MTAQLAQLWVFETGPQNVDGLPLWMVGESAAHGSRQVAREMGYQPSWLNGVAEVLS